MPSRYLMILTAAFLTALLSAGVYGGEMPSLGPEMKEDADRWGSVFDADRETLDLKSLRVDRTLKLPPGRVTSPVVEVEKLLARHSRSGASGMDSRRRMMVSILCSAILPGLGELYLYSESRDVSVLARSGFFLAVEGFCWYGQISNRSKGKDAKQDYMDYADAHWSEERFLEQHPCCAGLGGCVDYDEYNEHCNDQPFYFLYIPREADSEEYYENIGKYNAFVYGWDDWSPESDLMTPHRQKYWGMREESDEYLLRSDQYIMGLIINRVVSMIDAGWLAYRMGSEHVDDSSWSLDIESGFLASTISLNYRF